MTNKNVLEGMACPRCRSEEPFKIEMVATILARDDGTDADGDTIWDDDSPCSCVGCGFDGKVQDFRAGRLVQLIFTGSLDVVLHADHEDDGAWVKALSAAISALKPEQITGAVAVTGHELLSFPVREPDEQPPEYRGARGATHLEPE